MPGARASRTSAWIRPTDAEHQVWGCNGATGLGRPRPETSAWLREGVRAPQYGWRQWRKESADVDHQFNVQEPDADTTCTCRMTQKRV